LSLRYSFKREKIFFDILSKKFGIVHGTSLDVGCGYGFFTNLLQQMGHKTYGLDLDSNAIIDASKRYQSNFLIGDSTKMPFTNGTFDFILCRGLSVFYNEILDDASLQKEHLLDLLKDGGILIYITASNLTGQKTTIYNHTFHEINLFFSKSGYRSSVYFFFAQSLLFKIFRNLVFSPFITKFSSFLTKITKHSGYLVCIVEKKK